MAKGPPPDHLIPYSWLEKAGVSQDEIDRWTRTGIIVHVEVHGGAAFCHFPSQKKPVKFREIKDLIERARTHS